MEEQETANLGGRMTDYIDTLKSFGTFKYCYEDDTIVNAATGDDGKVAVNATGRYKALGFLLRSREQKAANNATRTMFLEALGKAFNLDGIRNNNGRITFDRTVLEKLEEKLGAKVFKASHFALDNQGNIVSGRPLTARRIGQILSKVKLPQPIKPQETIDYNQYSEKLTSIMDRFKGNEKATKNLSIVNKCLTALKTSAEQGGTIIMKNDPKNSSSPGSNFAVKEEWGFDGLGKPEEFLEALRERTGLPMAPNDKTIAKFLGNLKKNTQDPQVLQHLITKMLDKYHGGIPPANYDYRDDLIRELNDQLIKFVKLTVDLYDKCAENNQMDYFKDVISNDIMGDQMKLSSKLDYLEMGHEYLPEPKPQSMLDLI